MKNLLKVSCLASTLLLITLHAQGQDSFEPPAVAPSFRAVEITESITLDGKLTEESWGWQKR